MNLDIPLAIDRPNLFRRNRAIYFFHAAGAVKQWRQLIMWNSRASVIRLLTKHGCGRASNQGSAPLGDFGGRNDSAFQSDLTGIGSRNCQKAIDETSQFIRLFEHATDNVRAN